MSCANTDEHSSTQSDPAAAIEIALLRRQLWGAEKALKSKDEELFNKDQELVHMKRREREAEAVGRKDESYKGWLNEQKEMRDRAIRDVKDRGGVNKKPLAAADSRGELRQRRFKSDLPGQQVRPASAQHHAWRGHNDAGLHVDWARDQR